MSQTAAAAASVCGRADAENLPFPDPVEHVETPYDRGFAGPLAAATGSLLGWFPVVRGHAPNP